MSKLVACAVFDIAAQYYHPPVYFRATGAALRWFEDLCKNPEAKELHFHSDQFQLFHLGDFDDFSADFSLLPKPVLLVHGAAFSDANTARLPLSS